MKLQNIFNLKREVYIFERNDDGTQTITKDGAYHPYYYEPDPNGQYTAYDNKRVRKIIASNPGDVARQRSPASYEADILFTKRYVIDKISKFDKVAPKYFFLDIEVLAKEFPDPAFAKYPISCITIYNSHGGVQTWYLGDYPNEGKLLEDFLKYMKAEKPDMILAWNISFDYTYLHQRIKNFAKLISPIGQARYGDIDTIMYPAGISILDYMAMFKKIYMREQSYALDKIAQKYLGEPSWEDTEFGTLNDKVKAKNINDVNRMMKLEAKLGIISYYDEVRRFAMCLWEDLIANSRILDMIVLREAKAKGIVLPNKRKKEEGEDSDELQGAYRRADVGVFKNVYKADVASMYPNQLINFCLDTQNLRDAEEPDTINIDGVWVKQSPNALLPYISRKLIGQKDAIKAKLKAAEPNSDAAKMLQNNYNAIKGLVNSLYGVTAFPSFRLYNFTIASRITFLARDLLLYVEEHLKTLSYEVVYTDTDALMYKAEQDEIELLNKFVQDWATEKFEKPSINIVFESEGMFDKVLILGKCHYFGRKGTKEEIKGMEMKRSSSTKFETVYQRALVEMVLDEKSKDDIKAWVMTKMDDIKTLPLADIAFPAKISGTRQYKVKPIFIRAMENTQLYVKNFTISKGELFQYIFVKDYGKDVNNKYINVVVLTDKIADLKEHLDWDEILRRNILMKTDSIFQSLWGEPFFGLEPVAAPEPAPKKRRKRKEVAQGETAVPSDVS